MKLYLAKSVVVTAFIGAALSISSRPVWGFWYNVGTTCSWVSGVYPSSCSNSFTITLMATNPAVEDMGWTFRDCGLSSGLPADGATNVGLCRWTKFVDSGYNLTYFRFNWTRVGDPNLNGVFGQFNLMNELGFGSWVRFYTPNGTAAGVGGSASGSFTSELFSLKVDLTATNQGQTFTVVAGQGASSLVVVADGGNASDIDIDLVRTPTGREIVTPSRYDNNPLTGNRFPQDRGDSVATVMIPSSPQIPLEIGTYTFSLASFFLGFPVPATVNVTAFVNPRTNPSGGTLPVNFFFVGTPGLSASSALSSTGFQAVLDEFKLIYRAIGVQVEVAKLVDITGDAAFRLGALDFASPDWNFNKQSDEMDELMTFSAGIGNTAVNLFLVEEFTGSGTLGISAGIPGPPILQGTLHSGLVAATLGNLDSLPAQNWPQLGQTIAHEVAHYLGLYHTTEDNGLSFDPLADTPECRRPDNDFDFDLKVSFFECAGLDNLNLMFWQAPPAGTNQRQLTADQAFVLRRNPAVGD